MIDSKWTFIRFVVSWAGFDLVVASSHVTRITEVGSSPTEPQGDGAAEFALEVDVLCTMFVTVFDTRSDCLCRTSCTNQLFWLEFLNGIIAISTVNLATKVRVLALMAHVVCQLVKSKRA